jgi:3-hydroxyacyl-CoA dehydrogenase
MTARDVTVFESADVRCWHSADDALLVAFKQPRPSISAAVLDGTLRALDYAQARGQMLLIGAGQQHFAFGADLNDAFAAAASGAPDVLDRALAHYQQTMLALRHTNIPTIAITHGVAISGGCEMLMHCTRVVAAPRSPIGLVETSVGVLPGGGGVKEMARRAAMRAAGGDLGPDIVRAFELLAEARIVRAKDAGAVDLLTAQDVVSDEADLLAVARSVGVALVRDGFRPPPRNPSIRVAGADVLEQLLASQRDATDAGRLTAHQARINSHLAQVLCGGPRAAQDVTEKTLLTLEREHFVALAQTPETQARLAHLQSTGTVLRN